MTYHGTLGAISIDEDTGASPYKITGDPVVALIAQLNRFAGKSIQLKGENCKATRRYLGAKLPLVAVLNDKAAITANVIMYDIVSCVFDVRMIDPKLQRRVMDGLANAIPWAISNLADITVRIAQFGDAEGLDPAVVGITKRDDRVTPKFDPTTAVLVVAVALGALYVLKVRKS